VELGKRSDRIGRLEGGLSVVGVEPDAIHPEIKRSLDVAGEGVADHDALLFFRSGCLEHMFKEP